MMVSLEAKNKLGFVDRATMEPLDKDPKHGVWRRCNQIMKSWILNSINQTLINTMIFSNTTAEVWPDLNEQFSQGNLSRIFELKQQGIAEHRQQQQSITVYYTTLKSFWDVLGSYNNLSTCNCAGLKQNE
jgi:hypothetical protein